MFENLKVGDFVKVVDTRNIDKDGNPFVFQYEVRLLTENKVFVHNYCFDRQTGDFIGTTTGCILDDNFTKGGHGPDSMSFGGFRLIDCKQSNIKQINLKEVRFIMESFETLKVGDTVEIVDRGAVYANGEPIIYRDEVKALTEDHVRVGKFWFDRKTGDLIEVITDPGETPLHKNLDNFPSYCAGYKLIERKQTPPPRTDIELGSKVVLLNPNNNAMAEVIVQYCDERIIIVGRNGDNFLFDAPTRKIIKHLNINSLPDELLGVYILTEEEAKELKVVDESIELKQELRNLKAGQWVAVSSDSEVVMLLKVRKINGLCFDTFGCLTCDINSLSLSRDVFNSELFTSLRLSGVVESNQIADIFDKP